MGSELSTELLDAIIRQDKLRLCELQQNSYQHPAINLWLFHRWDRTSHLFKLIYPTLSPATSLPAELRHIFDGKKAVIDDNLAGRYGQWPQTQDYPVTLLVPLYYDTELLGVLQGFSKEDRDACQCALADISQGLPLVTQSWHMIHLLEEKERIACTDSLTGLFNSKFLLHFLKAELARCARYKKSVAVLFMDVDFFKRVNDVHGHLVGSAVLNELGRLIRANVRDADTVARYGGDEYVVVLTEVGREGATLIAERLRALICEHVFGRRRDLAVKLTISIGVAVFPDHGRTADELIHCADTAMYEAKNDNRNCVRVAV